MMIITQAPPAHKSPDSIRIAIESESVEVVDLRLVDARLRSLRAVASVRAAGIVIAGVRVVQLRGRLAVQMPESRSFGGIWEPVVVIEAPSLRAAINDVVLEAFKDASTCRGLT